MHRLRTLGTDKIDRRCTSCVPKHSKKFSCWNKNVFKVQHAWSCILLFKRVLPARLVARSWCCWLSPWGRSRPHTRVSSCLTHLTPAALPGPSTKSDCPRFDLDIHWTRVNGVGHSILWRRLEWCCTTLIHLSRSY